MALYRGTGGQGDATTDAQINDVTVKANEAANSALEAAESASEALVSANSASTSKTAAQNHASNALNSANNASTSASNAATSESNAADSASNAATSEANALISEGNAATSASNAAASFDNFDDRYLGAKASAPATDNDGDALITGALYFNSAAGKMQVWSGTAWGDLEGSGGGASEVNDLSTAVTWVNVPDAYITQSSVTQHQAALSITESQISDLGSYITASSTDTLTNKSGNISQWTNNSGYLTTVAIDDVSDVVITTPADNELLAYDNVSGNWINQTPAEAGLLTAEVNDLTSSVTWANIPDANVPQSAVTQHQAALSITESQISDLDKYTDADVDTHLNTSTATSSQVLSWTGTDYDWVDAATGGGDVVDDTTPQLGGDLDLNNNSITGTGGISITADIVTDTAVVAGEGSGGVALTINDGGGNANVCFNHKDQTPEQAGNAGRIDVNTDSTTNCHMTFGLSENVTSGVSTTATNIMELHADGEWYIDAGFGSLGQAFAVRAWVNMTPNSTINASGNVSSVSRTGTGTYRINFTNAMPDANYALAVMGNDGGSPVTFRTNGINTTYVVIEFRDSGGNLEDVSTRITVAVIR